MEQLSEAFIPSKEESISIKELAFSMTSTVEKTSIYNSESADINYD